MAVKVFTNSFLSINGVEISSAIKSCTMPLAIAALDATTMGSAATVINEPGLKNFSMSFDFLDDFTDNEINEDFHALWDGRTKFAVAWRPENTTIGTGNPEYQFTGFFTSLPNGGMVGTLAGGTCTLANSSALVRDVTP